METTIIDRDNLQYFQTLLLPETVQKLLLGEPVFALGAVDNGRACGALSGGTIGDSFFIDSIFVCSSCRRQGAATALLDELARIAALQENLSALRCSFTISCADHILLADFLERHGFAFEKVPDSVVSIPLGALSRLSFYNNTRTSVHVYTLSELSDSMLRVLDKRLAAEGGQLLEQPLDKAPLERDCSTVTVKNGAIDACLLIEKESEKLLSFSYADAGSTIGSGSVFSGMLITSYRQVKDKYPPDTAILIQPVTLLSQALLLRLAPPETRSLSRAAIRILR